MCLFIFINIFRCMYNNIYKLKFKCEKKNLSSSESIFRTVHSMFHHVGERREENSLLHKHTKCWIGFSYSIKQALNNVTQDMEVKYKQQWENNNLKSESEERLLTSWKDALPIDWVFLYVLLHRSPPMSQEWHIHSVTLWEPQKCLWNRTTQLMVLFSLFNFLRKRDLKYYKNTIRVCCISQHLPFFFFPTYTCKL